MKAEKQGFNYKLLRSVTAERGITNIQLGKRLGKSKTTISLWKQNKAHPTWSGLIALGKELGMDYKKFMI